MEMIISERVRVNPSEVPFFGGGSALSARAASSVPIDSECRNLIRSLGNIYIRLMEKGMDDDAIRALVFGKDNPKRIIYRHRSDLILPTEGNVSIKFTPMERTIYLFFLKHPEGVIVEEMWEHYDELCELYSEESIYNDVSTNENAVDSLCEDDRNTFYTNLSRIKRKLVDKIGKRAAKAFAITKDQDRRYRIHIPIDKVLIIER